MRWTAVLVALLALGACARGGAQPRADPAVWVALAVLALERSQAPLTPEQARQALPVLEALRALRPEEQQAAQALAERFDALLTPAQREALKAARERLRERLAGRPRQATPDPQRAAEVRRRLVDRALRVLALKAGRR